MRSGGTAEKNGKRREKVRVSCQSRAPAGTQRVPGPAGAADTIARRYTAALPALPRKGSIRFHNVYHVEPSIHLSGRGHRLLCRGLRRRPTAPPERHGVRSIQAGETSLDGAAVLRQGAVLSRIVRTAGCMAGNAGRDRCARLRRPQHRQAVQRRPAPGMVFQVAAVGHQVRPGGRRLEALGHDRREDLRHRTPDVGPHRAPGRQHLRDCHG